MLVRIKTPPRSDKEFTARDVRNAMEHLFGINTEFEVEKVTKENILEIINTCCDTDYEDIATLVCEPRELAQSILDGK